MGSAYWITGDTLDTLRQLPDGCIDVVITSPPFLALRSYLPADDPAKAHEIGQEGSPGAFIDVLLDITEELRRVLAPHGSICVELGDTYSGSGGAGGDYAEGGMREGQPRFKVRTDGGQYGYHGSRGGQKYNLEVRPVTGGAGWPDAKSACLIPELYRISLAYGVNPLTGRTTPRWRVRNTVRWVRPNPPVGALGDKFRPATSDMVIATMARDRYFDLDAVRVPYSPNTNARTAKGVDEKPRSGKSADRDGNFDSMPERNNDGAGAPPLDWWEIPTHPYKGSHYATFPPALVEKPMKAMCPLKVCTVCGKPSERIVEARYVDGAGTPAEAEPYESGPSRLISAPETLGWTDCGCLGGDQRWRNGRVLDIFGGSGTTLAVATGHGRDAIGIDLDARNVDLARERIGPMFFHEVTVAELAGMFGTREAA